MKGHKIRAWVLLMVMAMGPARAVAGQEGDEDWSEIAIAEEPPPDAFIPGTKVQFQGVGAVHRQ